MRLLPRKQQTTTQIYNKGQRKSKHCLTHAHPAFTKKTTNDNAALQQRTMSALRTRLLSLECGLCNELIEFGSNPSPLLHCQTKHEAALCYKCQYCKMFYPFYNSFAEHLLNCHGLPEINPQVQEVEASSLQPKQSALQRYFLTYELTPRGL